MLTNADDLGIIAWGTEGGAVGGPGSGAFYYHWWRDRKKTVVEACLSLDANRWMREGNLRAGVQLSGSWRWVYSDGRECSIRYEVTTEYMAAPSVRLSYSRTCPDSGQQEPIEYRVRLATTRPRFGGLRWWFVCPLVKNGWDCGRRVGKLFLPPGGRYFGCRHCHDLTYTSCQESGKFRGLYRKLAASTGYDIDTVRKALNSIGKRP
jgi:hypothetical protein